MCFFEYFRVSSHVAGWRQIVSKYTAYIYIVALFPVVLRQAEEGIIQDGCMDMDFTFNLILRLNLIILCIM
jgi:hypothetical protein